jgi:hypothetical protein
MWVENGETWVEIWRNCESSLQGERERGEWVKKGREGKRWKRSAEKETCHLRQTNEREREKEQGGCDTRGASLQYARCLHFLANPCLRYQDSKLFLRFFFSFLFSFLLVPGFTCRTELFTLCDKQASKQGSKKNSASLVVGAGGGSSISFSWSCTSSWFNCLQNLTSSSPSDVPDDDDHVPASFLNPFFLCAAAGRPAGVVWSFFVSPGASLDSRFIICYDRLILLRSRAREACCTKTSSLNG